MHVVKVVAVEVRLQPAAVCWGWWCWEACRTQHIHAARIHLPQQVSNLGGISAWRSPAPVEVGAVGVGAQVPAPGAIRVGVGHHVQHRACQQCPCHRVVLVGESLQQAICKPLCLGFSCILHATFNAFLNNVQTANTTALLGGDARLAAVLRKDTALLPLRKHTAMP